VRLWRGIIALRFSMKRSHTKPRTTGRPFILCRRAPCGMELVPTAGFAPALDTLSTCGLYCWATWALNIGASDRGRTRMFRLTRSAHLSATLAFCRKVERHAGAAPASPVWKTGVLSVGRMALVKMEVSVGNSPTKCGFADRSVQLLGQRPVAYLI
jgi:hypothetical protein